MHAHDHSHDHDHHHHEGDKGRLTTAALLTAGFMIVEAVGGWLSGSLALIADAGHMLTDAMALGLAWFAMHLAERPSDPARSYGYHRFQILAAFLNGIALFAIAAWIIYEAIGRIGAPIAIDATTMLLVAVAGFAVNAFVFKLLHGGSEDNLNVRAATLHVLSDLLGSAGAIVAAIVIMTTGWTTIDPILSMIVVLLILRSAYDVVVRSTHILLEGTPADISPDDVKASILGSVAGVSGVHHLHIWSLTRQKPVLTMHATVKEDAETDRVLQDIKTLLTDKFGIGHSTIQIESGHCPD